MTFNSFRANIAGAGGQSDPRSKLVSEGENLMASFQTVIVISAIVLTMTFILDRRIR